MASQDIAQNLRDNNNNWRAVKQAIEDKGVSTTGLTTADYDDAIRAIPTGGGGNLDTLNVTPTTSQQTLTPTSPVDGWDEVVVAAVDASIDSDIQSQNIRQGVNILGVQGSYAPTPNLQNKTVTPTISQLVISADQNYDGLDEVIVNAVTSAIDQNIQPGNIKQGISILGTVGTYTGGGSNYEQKSVTPDFSSGDVTVTPDSGYDALASVVIQKDSDLTPQNVKSGVEINGIVGTYTGAGVILNEHPTSLAYAGSGDTNNNSHSDILPADSSWTTAVDLTNLNASNGFRYVFYNNTTISSLDLRNWNFENITDVRYSFNGCSNLVTIQGTLRLDKCTTYTNMFTGCSKLEDCPITNFGFGVTTNTITLDLSASSVLDAHTMIQNFETNSSGKTRILKLHASVLAGLSSADTALAASKNITLQ